MAADNPSRRGTDWAAARDFWLALFPHRSYERVAQQFGISGTRVRFVARRDNWQKHADEIDARALERTKSRIVLSRAQRVEKTLGIVDGLLARFDESLDELELRPGELPNLVKLAELLVGEATERMGFSEIREALVKQAQLALRFIPKKDQARFLRELRAELGGEDAETA